MNNLFLNYELSLLAKEKGFNEPCMAYHRELLGSREPLFHRQESNYKPVINSEIEGNRVNMVAAPIYQQVLDWLRVNHDIHVVINKGGIKDKYTVFICANYDTNSGYIYENETRLAIFDYYEALNVGIEEALKKII